MIKKKKTIAIIVPNLEGGGAERTASKLLQFLSNHRYKKYIIVFDARNIVYEHDGELINLDMKASHNFIIKLINLIRRIYKLKIIKKIYHVEYSISFLDSANIVNLFSRGNDKIILSIRNFKSKNASHFYDQIHNYLIKKFYNYADVLVAVSDGVKEDLVKNYSINKNKIKVIYNFYDLKQIKKQTEQEIESKYRKIFEFPVAITMGRLTKQKGQCHLIRAFSKVKASIPNMQLIILGQGELEKSLKKLTKDLNIEKDVHFLGFQKNPYKYISRSMFFVFPSLYEGFPNALVEAMACSIPVISSDCDSGPREILAPDTNINHKTVKIEFGEYGILVPVCNGLLLDAKIPLTNEEKLLEESIIKLYSSREILLRYTKKIIDRALDFEVKEIISEYEKIIN